MTFAKTIIDTNMGTRYQKNTNLRKTTVLFLLLIMAGILLSSCRTRDKCAAYGEYRKYKVEQGY
jgi:hypothetical protein